MTMDSATLQRITELDTTDPNFLPVIYQLFSKFMAQAEHEFKMAEKKLQLLDQAWAEIQRLRVEDEFKSESFVEKPFST